MPFQMFFKRKTSITGHWNNDETDVRIAVSASVCSTINCTSHVLNHIDKNCTAYNFLLVPIQVTILKLSHMTLPWPKLITLLVFSH